MKILKQGVSKKWWEGKVGTCKTCGTVVELQAGDDVNAMIDRNEHLAAVACPACKRDIWVYPNSPDHECNWKTRAAQHGCDVVNGDHECG